MDIDLKTLAPDSTIPAGAVLFGADSQAAAQPSVYPLSDVVAVATATTASAANTFTADQVISKPTPVFVLNKTASGQFLSLRGSTNGSLRWEMPLGNSTAESGSNAGSDFEIASYTDAGTGRAVRMRIRRSDGFTTIGGSAEIGTPDASNSLLLRRRSTTLGGSLLLEVPSTGNTWSGSLTMDISGNRLRFYEGGGSFRGFNVDMTTCGGVDSTPLIHSGNIAAQIAAIAHTAVGAYGLFRDNSTTNLGPGVNVTGSSLLWASNLAASGNPSGIWRRHGQNDTSGTSVTLYNRQS
ncbi:MAG: hypothetical protein IOC49_06800 [Methylobacterium sp.]|nr:hypothetical protein [Methylobacterium sp.]